MVLVASLKGVSHGNGLFGDSVALSRSTCILLVTLPSTEFDTTVLGTGDVLCVRHQVRVLVDRSIVEVFIGGGRVAAVMAYQPPNAVTLGGRGSSPELWGYTSVHLFAHQPQSVSNVAIHQMGCGWNQTELN